MLEISSIHPEIYFNFISLYCMNPVLYCASTVMFLLSQVGDQLIEINGYSTHNITHTEAIDLIQNGGATVRLKVKRSAKMHPHLGAYFILHSMKNIHFVFIFILFIIFVW